MSFNNKDCACDLKSRYTKKILYLCAGLLPKLDKLGTLKELDLITRKGSSLEIIIRRKKPIRLGYFMPRKLCKDYSFCSLLYRLSQMVEHSFDLIIIHAASNFRSQYYIDGES